MHKSPGFHFYEHQYQSLVQHLFCPNHRSLLVLHGFSDNKKSFTLSYLTVLYVPMSVAECSEFCFFEPRHLVVGGGLFRVKVGAISVKRVSP